MPDAYRNLIDILQACRRVLVTTHVRPDGDALGTAAAMVLPLRQAKIEAEVLLLSRLPRKYSFVFEEYGIVHHDAEKGWPAALKLESFDALLVVDTGTWSQLPGRRSAGGFSQTKDRGRSSSHAGRLGGCEAGGDRSGGGGGDRGGSDRSVGTQHRRPDGHGPVPRHRFRHRLVRIFQHSPLHAAIGRGPDRGGCGYGSAVSTAISE